MALANSEWREITVESGIQHEPFPPHQLSGVAEWMIRTLKEMSTSMLVQAGLLPELWSKAMTTVAYIRNRLMFNSSLPQRWRRFPTEKMKDQYSQLKPFSCLCYVIVPEEKQKSFTSKTRHVRFLVLYGTLRRFLRCWILLYLYSSERETWWISISWITRQEGWSRIQFVFPYRSILSNMNPNVDKRMLSHPITLKGVCRVIALD